MPLIVSWLALLPRDMILLVIAAAGICLVAACLGLTVGVLKGMWVVFWYAYNVLPR